MSTVPASAFVNVTPNVLAAGGSALDLSGLMLTTSTRTPIGTVLSFPDAAAVSNYFGGSSQEAAIASNYFSGFDNSSLKPGAILVAQFNTGSVSAYLRGGNLSAVSLATLQSLNAAFSVTIDGVVKAATIDLSGATSFSNAAELIAFALGIEGVQAASVTGSIGGTFTCTSTGTTLNVSAVLTGSLQPGDHVSGTDTTNSLPGGCTIVAQLTGAAGSTGTYQLSAAATPGNLTSCTVTATSNKLKVTVVASGAIGVADVISGAGITANTYITSIVSGTGGIGIYALSGSPQRVASEAVTVFTPGVVFDSISSAFIIVSGTAGVSSTITYGTGALADALLLATGEGGVLSQGAVAAVPSTFMTAVIAQTQDWATFFTLFNPDNSGHANKLLFAEWVNGTNDRYAYSCWDTDTDPTTIVPATGSLGYAIQQASLSGAVLTYALDSTTGPILAAFVCGAVASIDFEEANGRTTLAFRSQSGIVPSVTDQTVMLNLISNGYNSYVAAATANQDFDFYYPGMISGPFNWIDSYINQIWLNNAFQLALMLLLTQAKSIPYNTAGNAMISAALADPINAGLNFGAFRPGVVLSASQVAAVNAATGVRASDTLQTAGWYLQVLPASPTVRQARGSPPCKFFYMDGESVQSIDLTSIAVQ